MGRVDMDPSGQARIAEAALRLRQRLAEDVAEDARRLAPSDTGALRAGIHVETSGEDVTVVSSRHVDGDDPKVPVYVELGTHDAPAQPYLRPAVYRRRTP